MLLVFVCVSLAAGGRRQWLSEGGAPSDQSGDGGDQPLGQYFVRVIPLVLAAFPPARFLPPVVSLPLLRGDNIGWREREHQDVGVLMLRILVASQVFGKDSMSLARLLTCREPSHRGRLGLLDQELWLPQHNTHVKKIHEQLTAAEFDQHVAGYMQDPASQPFAFVGPSNFKADGWLLLRKALLDGTGRAVEPGEPFIIYTSSKQRMKQESVSAAAIESERDKDVMSRTHAYVYAYITDQVCANAPAANDIVVIGPREHEAFYGACAALLRVSKV